MVKSSKKALAVLLAVACLITFMPAMASQSFAAKKLTVKPAKKTIYVKKSVTLKANQKVKWSASKSSLKVVKLTSKKAKSVKVTGKKAGKAVVTAKVGKQTKKVTITVKKAKAAVKKTAVTAVALSADNAKDPAKEVLVGTKLRAEVTPENATVTYQWKADGTAIADATKSTFTVSTAEIGKAITVEATGTGNFEKTAVSAATAKVAAVKINTGVTLGKYVAATADTKANYDENVDEHTEGATVGVGDVLKAKLDVENAEAADAVTYQWYRTAQNAAGTPYDAAIEGATSETYTVTAADKNAQLYVVVTPKNGVVVKNGVTVKDGKLTSNKSVAVTAAVKVEIQVDGKKAPTAVTLGKTLTAVVTPSTANVTFQWKKGGVAIPGATSATYKPEVKGTYTVEAKLADNEMVFTGVTQAASVKITDQTINAAILKGLKKADGSAKPVAVGDELNLVVYAKNADGMDVALPTSDYRTEMYINGAKAYPKDTASFTANTAAINTTTIPTDYMLKGDTANRPVKVNDTISFKVIGTGDYAGVELDSNALSVAKLGTLTAVHTGVNAKQAGTEAKIHIEGLKENDGLTATIFKVTGTGTTATYTKIGAVTYKDTQETGAVDFALDSDVSKNGDKYVVSVTMADYDGSVDLDTITLTGLSK